MLKVSGVFWRFPFLLFNYLFIITIILIGVWQNYKKRTCINRNYDTINSSSKFLMFNICTTIYKIKIDSVQINTKTTWTVFYQCAWTFHPKASIHCVHLFGRIIQPQCRMELQSMQFISSVSVRFCWNISTFVLTALCCYNIDW